MNKFEYNKLTPFKWFVLENFPFIEEDFDALTNWQVFCKLGKEMNKIINSVNISGEQVETLTTAFNDLQNYVNNYFNNLDVQEEINNKLDKMAEDGTLLSILLNYINIERVYNTFQDLINDNTLVNNIKVKTLGYYEINDGGNCNYYITNEINNNIIQIPLNNGLYANPIVSNLINVKCVGAKANNETNDTNIIQECLNKYNIVYLPKGVYNVTELSLNSNNIILGDGNNTVLSSISDGDGIIKIINGFNQKVKDIHLQGNNNNIDGILLNRIEQTSIDSNEIIENVKIEFCNNGININSTYVRSCFILNCNISNNKKDGIIILGTDNFIENTLSYWNKGNGIHIKDGASNKINNSKTFGNSLNGLLINASAVQISNVESQDNYQHGLLNYQCWGNNYTNVTISTNGVDNINGSNYANILFENSYDCNFNGVIVNRNTPKAKIMHSKFGLKIKNSYNINVDTKLHLLNIGLTPFDNENLNVSNKISINNVNYNLKNIYQDKFIGKEGDISGLSQILTQSNARVNSDGSFNCNLIENSQNMVIGNNSTIDGTGFISVYGEIDITNNEKNISLYVNGSNNKPEQSNISGIISFINSSGGLISSSNEVYGKNSFAIDSVIPENTTKIRYTINYRPTILNLNGVYSVNDIKLAIY